MKWAEPLPQNCPPKEANPPNHECYYRLIEYMEPSEIDFCSHRMRWPDKQFHTSECVAMAISVFDKISSCQKVRLFPTHKNKKIVEITLPQESGLIKQNGRDLSHFSWWRYKEFNPFDFCTIIEA
jgi:hypothetical protein